jgi:hypothetical protein
MLPWFFPGSLFSSDLSSLVSRLSYLVSVCTIGKPFTHTSLSLSLSLSLVLLLKIHGVTPTLRCALEGISAGLEEGEGVAWWSISRDTSDDGGNGQ